MSTQRGPRESKDTLGPPPTKDKLMRNDKLVIITLSYEITSLPLRPGLRRTMLLADVVVRDGNILVETPWGMDYHKMVNEGRLEEWRRQGYKIRHIMAEEET